MNPLIQSLTRPLDPYYNLSHVQVAEKRHLLQCIPAFIPPFSPPLSGYIDCDLS